MTLTLQYGSTEKTLEAWGFTSPHMSVASQSARVFSLFVPAAPEEMAADLPIPFGGEVKIKRAGTIIFRGYQTTLKRLFNADGSGFEMVFADALWLLDQTVYQQSWSYKPPGGSLSTTYFSRLILFQDFTTGYLLDSGAQIRELIEFAATQCGIAIQAGTIDIAMPQPTQQVKAMFIGDALRKCLQPDPSAQLWIDPTTEPPSLHCRARANLATISLPWKDGTTHESGEITRRYDLEVPCVQVQYQKTGSVDGRAFTQFDTRTYPALASPLQPRALVIPIDVRGLQVSDLVVSVQSDTFDPSSLDWWKMKKPDLARTNGAGSPMIDSLTLLDYAVTDESGAAIDLDTVTGFAYEFIGGDPLTWMRTSAGVMVQAVRAVVTARFSYNELDENLKVRRVITSVEPHQVVVRIRLTNSPPGDPADENRTYYSTLQHRDPGEVIPSDMESYLYNALQNQFEGTHTIRKIAADATADIDVIYGPWQKLNLTGGRAEWASMAAAIQSVDYDFTRGQVGINFGPPRHLSPGELWSWFQTWSWRVVYDNPNLRISASQDENSAPLGGSSPGENTTSANAPFAQDTIAAPVTGEATLSTVLVSNAVDQEWRMEVRAADGSIDSTKARVEMALSTLPAGEVAKFRQVCVKVSGVSLTAWALMTEPK